MFIQCNFLSKTLGMNTNVNIIIPSPDGDEIISDKKSSYLQDGTRYQVLYLLHGAYGDYSDWQRFTSIERYAQEHKVAVVMPSVTNSFYQNMVHGHDFFTYITEELPDIVKSYFPISQQPENTFIAGLSMEGYGALFTALSKPEKYKCAASLSGAVDISRLVKEVKENKLPSPFSLENIFGNTENLANTDVDLFALIKKHLNTGTKLPELFMACGSEDFLSEMNKSAAKRIIDLGARLTFEEYPGTHDWTFWDTYIQRVLTWLPLKGETVTK